MQPQTFVFFGIAGSGKGTQVKLLTDYLKSKGGGDTVYAGTGEGFRHMMATPGFTSEIVKEKMSRGEYIDDFLTNALFVGILMSELSPEKNLIADGYPRTLPQAKEFADMMNFFKRDNINVIYIEVGKEESIKRNMLRGRQDDTPEGLEKRFDEYMTKVIPAMNYFNDKPGYKIIKINGEQSIEMVHGDIIKALNF